MATQALLFDSLNEKSRLRRAKAGIGIYKLSYVARQDLSAIIDDDESSELGVKEAKHYLQQVESLIEKEREGFPSNDSNTLF
jgi:hypothetical protein